MSDEYRKKETYGRRPGDEPFGGIPDLIDERLIESLKKRAEIGSIMERKSIQKYLVAQAKKSQASHGQ